MKGITPIVSIVILLLIAVAIAGAGYTWITGYYGGLTSAAIQVTDIQCIAGTGGDVDIRYSNIGTDPITIVAGDVSREDIGNTTQTDPSYTFTPATLNPGIGGIITDAFDGSGAEDPEAGATYRYFILVGGRTTTTQVTC